MSTKDIAFSRELRVLDESEDFLVVDKPAPLLIHPTRPGQNDEEDEPTLWGELRRLLAFEMAQGGQVSIINRLDRETSGVVLVAKHAEAARELGIAMQAREVEKCYLALCRGWPEGMEEGEEVLVDAPILRGGELGSFQVWLKQVVHPEGKAARTRFRLVEKRLAAGWGEQEYGKGEKLSLWEARPETGRMHQIRVHANELGVSVLGDKLYGVGEECYLEFMETGWTEALAQKLWWPRQALHSWKLGLSFKGKDYVWEARDETGKWKLGSE